jgi:hypothetical protein
MQIQTLQQNPQLNKDINKLHKQFPNFVVNGGYVGNYYWNEVGLVKHFPEYQFGIVNDEGELIGCGHMIPLYWNGQLSELPEGYDAAISLGFKNKFDNVEPNVLCALAAVTGKNAKEKKISYEILNGMKDIAKLKNLSKLIAPVAPLWKHEYPLTPLQNYAKWLNVEGKPFDPWLRAHTNIGGKVIGLAERSMHIKGNISEWEKWTGMKFPESGSYIVPGASQPLSVDLENDFGEYYDQNIWVEHKVY